MKNPLSYLQSKFPFVRESLFFIFGLCISLLNASRDQAVSVEDQARAMNIAFVQRYNDSINLNKNRFGEAILKNREVILPAILHAPAIIDSLTKELHIAREERDFYKSVVNN